MSNAANPLWSKYGNFFALVPSNYSVFRPLDWPGGHVARLEKGGDDCFQEKSNFSLEKSCAPGLACHDYLAFGRVGILYQPHCLRLHSYYRNPRRAGLDYFCFLHIRPCQWRCYGQIQKKRTWLPAVHGVFNTILLILVIIECFTGYELLETFR